MPPYRPFRAAAASRAINAAMTILKWLAIPLVLYLGFVTLLYASQRAMMYVPERTRTPPNAAGLAQAEEVILDTADGERIIAWHIPPRDGRPVVLYLHGNGGSLRHRASRFRNLADDGIGVVALSYRGYGGSSGSPSEVGLIADAQTAYAFARQHYPANRLVLWGESLGTGVAVALAAQQPVARMILQSPFTSAADIAASAYPLVPVRWLMKDPFHSDRRIGAVDAPIMIVHGARDQVVPISHGERLYEMIETPKRFLRLPSANHNDHEAHDAMSALLAFILDDPDR